MYQPIKGKVVFLTGGGRGIGRALAQKMAQYGASVVVTSLHLNLAEETADMLVKNLSDQIHTSMQLDVTDSENVDAVMKNAADKYGRIDILLNNAGVSTMNKVENITDKDWDFNFDVISKGTFYCTRAAIPYLKKSRGKIVNTASMASFKPVPLLSHYTAAKWAVAGFTKTTAIELAPYGITVNCVCPGYVKTNMQSREVLWEAELRNMTPEEVLQEYISLTPLGRLCQPEDVANAVGFLVSPEASFITGVALHVTGGAEL
ncbi:MAG: SDR family oxidoreductase [Clostridiaceae bacterium]|nr:SDR family oxidoreductase [Clostridiaceae bacterium]